MWDLFMGWLDWSIKVGWVLVAMLAVRRLLWDRLSAEARFALWALPAARLAIPHLPASPFSVQQGSRVLSGTPIPGLDPVWTGMTSPSMAGGEPATRWAWMLDWQVLLPALWIFGTVVLLRRVLTSLVQGRRWISESRPATEPHIVAVRSACEAALGIRDEVPARWSSRVDGPVVCGLFRPTILLPETARHRLVGDRLRHVLLHELAHVRRRDPIWQISAALAVSIHWLNPLVWIAYGAFRDDLEMACDGRALGCLPLSERSGYGHTLLDLGIRCPETLSAAGFAVASKKQLKRRIEMIVRFQPKTRWSALGLFALVGALAAMFLTDLPLTADDRETQRIRELTPTEIGKIFAQKLSSSHKENPVTVASELSTLWQENHDQADEIRVVLAREVESASARGNVELAGTLTKMLKVLAEQDGIEAVLPMDARSRASTTVQILRGAGTALHSRFGMPARSATEPVPTEINWDQCPRIATQRVRKLADEQGWGPLPAFDAWGHQLEYCLSGELLQGSAGMTYRFGVRSPGLDGEFSGGAYDIGAFDVRQERSDIVWLDGYFATWPELEAAGS